MTTPRHVQAILDRTRDYLIEKGWTKGNMYKDDGTACTWGHVRSAAKVEIDRVVSSMDLPMTDEQRRMWVTVLEHDATVELARRIRELNQNVSYHATATAVITTWNDHRDRTMDDVLTLLSEKWEASKEGKDGEQ